MLSMVVELEKPLPAPEVILIGLMAAVVVLVRALWEIAGPFETVVHESAHVLAGILTGRTIRSVRIEETGGGSTDMSAKSGCGYGVAAFVGYIGPSAAGLIAAGLISTGRMYAVLWLGLVLLAVMLLTIRNFFGGLVIVMGGALLYLVVRYGTAEVETAFAYGVAWFLLFSGIRLALRAAGRPKDVKDAEILAGMTFLFRWVWCLLWLAGTIAALAVGGRILIRSLELALRIQVCLGGTSAGSSSTASAGGRWLTPWLAARAGWRASVPSRPSPRCTPRRTVLVQCHVFHGRLPTHALVGWSGPREVSAGMNSRTADREWVIQLFSNR